MRPLNIFILLINTLLILQGSFLLEVLASHTSSSDFQNLDLHIAPSLVRANNPNARIVSPSNRPHEEIKELAGSSLARRKFPHQRYQLKSPPLTPIKEEFEEPDYYFPVSFHNELSKGPLFSMRKKGNRLVFSAPTSGPRRALENPPFLSLKDSETPSINITKFLVNMMKTKYKKKCQKFEQYADFISLSHLYQKFTSKFT